LASFVRENNKELLRRKSSLASLIVVFQKRSEKRGVTSFALGFCHGATAATDTGSNGDLIKGETRRAAGLHANAAM
jgi:hypothetical protein